MEKITQTAGRNQPGGFAPDFAHYNDDILFGENWNNQECPGEDTSNEWTEPVADEIYRD